MKNNSATLKVCNLLFSLLVSVFFLFTPGLYARQSFFWNRGRGYQPFSHASDSCLRFDNQSWLTMKEGYKFNSPADAIELSFRSKNLHANPHKKYPYVAENRKIAKLKDTVWGFFIFNDSGDSIKVRISRCETPEAIESRPQSLVEIIKTNPDSLITRIPVDVDPNGSTALWSLSNADDMLSIWAGNRMLQPVASMPSVVSPCSGFGFFAEPAAHLIVTDIKAEIRSAEKSLSTETVGDDPLLGDWALFDRELDEAMIKPGGDYILRIVKDKDLYHILYIDGAIINPSQWNTGRRKATLYPTHFKDIFNVEWIDAEGNPISNGVKAQTIENEILTIQFPYHSSSIRLRKIKASP